MAKVFVANKGHHAYHDAAKYGDVVFLTEGRPNLFQSDNLYATLREGLEVAGPEDFLVLSGNILPSAIAMHILLKKHGVANLLVWMGNQNRYARITLAEV